MNRAILVVIAILLLIIAGALIVPHFTKCEKEFNVQAVSLNQVGTTIMTFEAQGWKLERNAPLRPGDPTTYLTFARCKP